MVRNQIQVVVAALVVATSVMVAPRFAHSQKGESLETVSEEDASRDEGIEREPNGMPGAAVAEARRWFGDMTILGGPSTYVGQMWGANLGLNAHLGRNFAATLRVGTYPIDEFGPIEALTIGPKVGGRWQFPVDRTMISGGMELGPFFFPVNSQPGLVAGIMGGLEYLVAEDWTVGLEANLGVLSGLDPFRADSVVNGQATLFVGWDFSLRRD